MCCPWSLEIVRWTPEYASILPLLGLAYMRSILLISCMHPNPPMYQGSNKPKYMMAGSINTGVPTSYSKKANRSATDAEVDDYLRSLREAVEKKYNLLYRAFEAVDKDRNGHLSFDEVAAVVEHFGLPIPSTHVHEVFYQVPIIMPIRQTERATSARACLMPHGCSMIV